MRKQGSVQEAFAQYPSLSHVNVPLPVESPKKFGYRSRVKLAVRGTKRDPKIGLYIPDSHDVFDVSQCPVHPREINHIVNFLKKEIQLLKIAPYDERRDIGQLRYLDLRYSFWQKKVLLMLVTRHMHFPEIQDLTRALERRFPFLAGVIQNINDEPGNSIWGKRFRPLRGRDSLLEQIGHVRVSVPIDTFSQVNPPIARRIYETIVRWTDLTGEEFVLDLYTGTGPIALYFASRAKLVAGIEENRRAVSVAKENARRNGYNNTRFFFGDVAEQTRAVALKLPQFDVICLNPPRKGLTSGSFNSIVEIGAKTLVYVSCSPRTLARDLDKFCASGYGVVRAQSFDMFPQTDQVETAMLLRRT